MMHLCIFIYKITWVVWLPSSIPVKTLKSLLKQIFICNTKHVVVKLYNFQSKAASVQGMVSMYLATLTEETNRFLRQQFFLPSSDLRCLVATVAFEMVSICDVK